MLLAGDIGGTKTLLGLFSTAPERPAALAIREFTTLRYENLPLMIHEFFDSIRCAPDEIEAAAFGVAGPVLDQVARLTNVPWRVEALEVSEQFAVPRIALLNDLTAMAYAVPVLRRDELAVLQEGQAVPTGNAALIAAGTGLGEALLHNVDGRFIPSPSEGGHADFAARTEREMAFARELIRSYGRAHYEHALSGPGLVNLYRFTHRDPCPAIDPDADLALLPSLITASALGAQCRQCKEALQLFVEIYGAETGNLALRSVATAGIYVGGGIAPRILPALEAGAFIDAFRAKEPMVDLLAAIPVCVILNTQAGLLGAAVYANTLLLTP